MAQAKARWRGFAPVRIAPTEEKFCSRASLQSLGNPRDAQRLGIGIVYQELDLFPHLTVGENMVIGNLRFPEGMLVEPGCASTLLPARSWIRWD